jgi:hypothetical protein
MQGLLVIDAMLGLGRARWLALTHHAIIGAWDGGLLACTAGCQPGPTSSSLAPFKK